MASDPVQAWQIGTEDVILTTANSIDIFRGVIEKKDDSPNAPSVKKTKLVKKIENYQLGKNSDKKNINIRGFATNQITYTDDGTLAFIINMTVGNDDSILVLDTQTLEIVHEIKIPNFSTDLTSLAVDSDWLYVTSGTQWGNGSGRLLRINIDQLDVDFLNDYQEVDLGLSNTSGFLDMAINNGSYMAITSPQGSKYGEKGGNVYVIDLNKIDDEGKLQDDVLTLTPEMLRNNVATVQTKYPQYIVAGSNNGEFILSSEKDINKGVTSFTIKTDEKGKIKNEKPTVNNLSLSPKYSYLDNVYGHYRQEIQNASDIVYVTYNNAKKQKVDGKEVMVDDITEYAIVGDSYYPLDNYLNTYNNNFGAGKQMGGKLGIIKDPFGKKGTPTFLGSTTPMDFGWLSEGMVGQLTIGDDGLLYGNVWTDNPTYGEDGSQNGWTMHKDLFVWDAKELIAMAEAAYENNKGNITKPFDLSLQTKTDAKGNVLKDEHGNPIQSMAQINPPQRIEGLQKDPNSTDINYFGWIYGLGKYASSTQMVNLGASQNADYYHLVTHPYYGSGEADNVYTDMLGVSEREIIKKIQDGTFKDADVPSYWGKRLFYKGWNLFTNDFVERNGGRYEDYSNGKISGLEYASAGAIDGVASVLSFYATSKVGLIAENYWGSSLTSLAAESITYSIIDTGDQAAVYQIAGGEGKSAKPVKSDAVLEGLSMNAMIGSGLYLLGRIGSGSKTVWKAPTEDNPLNYRVVTPRPTPKIKLKDLFTKADTSNSHLFMSKITVNGKEIKFPELNTQKAHEAATWLLSMKKDMKDYADEMINNHPNISWAEKAEIYTKVESTFVNAARLSIDDPRLIQLAEINAPLKDFKTLEKDYAKDGLSGDALYKKIYDDMFNFGCFVAGTLVTTDKGKIPIQDIKVGDRVLSKPEDGIGEPEFKPVLKTFIHEEKPIWMVRASKSPNFLDSHGEMIDYQKYKMATRTIDFLATPNHPVWVIGISNANRDITFYERPHWKRVDELLQYEHAVNADGVMYYITDVQPIYRFAHPDVEPNPNYYWYEKNYGKDYYDDYLHGDVKPDLEVTEEYFKTVGYVKNVENYNECGLLGRFVKDTLGDVELTNSLRDTNGQLIPFTTTVYNMEVADNHSYFIDDAKLWVHNTDCEEKALKILLGEDTTKGFAKLTGGGKQNFASESEKNIKNLANEDFAQRFEQDIQLEKDINQLKQDSIAAVQSPLGILEKDGKYSNGKIEETGTQNWQRIQQLALGSFTKWRTAITDIFNVKSGGDIHEISLAGINVINGQSWAKAIGDVLQVLRIEHGVPIYGAMLKDIKAGFGAAYDNIFNVSTYRYYQGEAGKAELRAMQDQLDNIPAKIQQATTATEKADLQKQMVDLEKELKDKSQFAFDFKRENLDKSLPKTEFDKKLKDITNAEDEFKKANLSDAQLKTQIKELIGTGSLLELHGGSIKFSLSPSLKWMPTKLTGSAQEIAERIGYYNDILSKQAKQMAEYLGELSQRKDLIAELVQEGAFVDDHFFTNLQTIGNTKWDPRTGEWLSPSIYIEIPELKQVTLYDKATGQFTTQYRTDAKAFYAIGKDGSVKEVGRDIIPEINTADPTHQGLQNIIDDYNQSDVQHQMLNHLPSSDYTPTMTTAQLQTVLDNLADQVRAIPSLVSSSQTISVQAEQAVQRLNQLISNTHAQLTDSHLKTAFAQLLPPKTIAQFSQHAQDKGLIGDAVWQSVIIAVSQYIEQDTLGCFMKGTLVRKETDIFPIQEIKVGDKVLCKPESSVGEATYKLVNETYTHHNKPIWLVETAKIVQLINQQGDMLDYKQYKSASSEIRFLVTPNHPIWIIGILQNDTVVFYDQPQWKRVDELQRKEVAVNQHGVMYSVQRAQPTYQYQAVGATEASPDLYWYQKYYYEDYEQDYLYGDVKPDFDVTEADYKSIGYVYDATYYEQEGLKGVYIDECANQLKDEDNQYIPFTRTVYNLEVADYHTYYIGITGLWVHNTSSLPQTLLQTARDIANGVRQISDNQLQSMYQVAKQYWLDAGATAEEMANISLTLGQLSDDALATTEGKLITVSPNAGGWGWFVDTTPNLNEEFTLGKNSYQANIGSEAEHKIDLLTVLIHEIGNVLGVSHRTDGDIMTLRLADGERRLPNQTDSQYLAWLKDNAINQVAQTGLQVLQAKAWTAPNSNATLTNNDFTTQGTNWLTTGDIRFDSRTHSATLTEVENTQTSLRQAFSLTADNRILSFTIADKGDCKIFCVNPKIGQITQEYLYERRNRKTIR